MNDSVSERAELREAQRRLRQYTRDRQLLAYEIHDGLVQYATGALMQLEAMLDHEAVRESPVRQNVEAAIELSRRVVTEGRRLIGGLRPPLLEDQGLPAALGHLVDAYRRSGLAIEFSVEGACDRLDPFTEETLFRIVQEGLTNVSRHSRSPRATVRLAHEGGCVRVEIRDFGVGFDPTRVAMGHWGLEGIRERARLLDGRAEIASAPGEGTRIWVELPAAKGRGELAASHE